MFKNYLLTTIRQLIRNKGFSLINILGFAIGIACTVLILLWVTDELRYDSYHKKKDRIYRVLAKVPSSEGDMKVGVTPAALAPALQDKFPSIEKATRFRNYASLVFIDGDKKISEPRSALAESKLFSIFTFPFIEGNPETCLDQPNSIVLTEKIAAKYFGDTCAIGKKMEIADLGIFNVTGVIENISHCHFEFNYAISFEWVRQLFDDNIDEFGSYNYSTYILEIIIIE